MRESGHDETLMVDPVVRFSMRRRNRFAKKTTLRQEDGKNYQFGVGVDEAIG